MKDVHPGVPKVYLLVVLSEVKSSNTLERKFAAYLDCLFDACEWIDYLGLITKDNLGRDFSSVLTGLKSLEKDFEDQDFIMVRNRSAFGPFRSSWYLDFCIPFSDVENLALVGNSINLSSSLDKVEHPTPTHVQTYVYVTKWQVLKVLIDDFPGLSANTRLEVVNNGEVALSQRLIQKGFAITSLWWPGYVFNNDHPSTTDFPMKDQKKKVKGLAFKHRQGFHFYIDLGVYMEWLKFRYD